MTNRLEDWRGVFDGIEPWAGEVPIGYGVDFVGTFTHASFRETWRGDPSSIGGRYVETRLPTLADREQDDDSAFQVGNWDGERWFEAVDWFVAAREARDRFTMITLGAWHGSQAVGSYRALQLVNPMPSKLIAVEPEPENCEFTRRHFRNNGIDPDACWLIPMAISDRNIPVLFPIGPRTMGSQNCLSTNELQARKNYLQHFIDTGTTPEALRGLLLRGTTGLHKGLGDVNGTVAGGNDAAEIKYVSSITLADVLGPFDVMDYVESDIQESEILVFPPFIDLLRKKVRRIHIGTHGKAVHASLHELFARHDWDVVFSFEPETEHHTALGAFKTGDGVLTVRNPDLAR